MIEGQGRHQRMSIRTLDLFSGGGGSSYGARAAGAEIVCGVDAWEGATAAYAANFPTARAITRNLTPDTRARDLGDIGKIDLLLASPECTNHTCARGSRERDEGSRDTARYVLNFVQDLRPRWVVIENVIQMRSWHGYDQVLNDLQDAGYNIRVDVLDASRFGVAQARKRLFIVADRDKIPGVVRKRPGRSRKAMSILDLEAPWESRPLRKEGRAEATLERAERAISTLGTGVPFLIVYYGSDGGGGWQRLDRPLRTITTLDRFGLVTWNAQMPMLRMLQVPELTRAMGFGPDYCLDVLRQRRERIKILGNGVAPPVMEAVVSALIGNVVVDAARPSARMPLLGGMEHAVAA